jgi:hypothetical protein
VASIRTSEGGMNGIGGSPLKQLFSDMKRKEASNSF